MFADKGTALHALIEHADSPGKVDEGEGPPAEGLTEADAEEVEAWHAAWEASAIGQEEWLHEKAVAYDVASDTARWLPGKDRDYSGVTETEVPGTVDLHRIEWAAGKRTRVIVCDTKTGWQAWTDAASENMQLHGYALALARIYGVDEATVVVAYVDEHGVRTSTADLDAIDLLRVGEELKRQMAERADSTPKPGFWCRARYCPALEVCPATEKATASLLKMSAPGAFTLRIQSSADAQRVLYQLGVAGKMLDAANRELRLYADLHGGIPMPGGRVWRGTVVDRETIDLNGPGFAEALSILGESGADQDVKTRNSLSKADVLKRLKKSMPPAKANAALAEIMAKLRVVDATKSVEIVRYGAAKAEE